VRHFFNLHAARFRRHKDVLPRLAVEHNAQIEFALNRQRLLNQQPLHQPAFRSRLVRHQRHAENLLRHLDRFRRVFRDFHAAALAASTRMDLRFHHYAAADLLRRGLAFLYCIGDFAAGHRHVVFGENRFRLILMNFHKWIWTKG